MKRLRALGRDFGSRLSWKFLAFYVLVTFVPLVLLAVSFYAWGRSTLLNNSQTQLSSKTEQLSNSVERYFDQQSSMMLQLAGNPAFVRRYTDTRHADELRREVEQAFEYVHSIYPKELDEACFIDRGGAEIARIVGDKIAGGGELSSDETAAPFFKPTFELAKGKVYQSRPYISADSGRWVIANSTPIVLPSGKNAAIAHFEVNLGSFRRLLTDTLPLGKNEFAFIVDTDSKKLMVSTRQKEPVNEPFAAAAAAVGRETSASNTTGRHSQVKAA